MKPLPRSSPAPVKVFRPSALAAFAFLALLRPAFAAEMAEEPAGRAKTAVQEGLEVATFELPSELPSAVDVKDPIFALLIGLVDGNLHGTLDQRHIQDELNRRHVKSKLPYEHVLDVTRLPSERNPRLNEVRVRFDGALKLPIPYSILGYNPGSLRATEECRFLEWKLGDVQIGYQKKEGDEYIDIPIQLRDVYLYGVTEGKLDLDIDGWVDRLMGGSLDDTAIVALMLCRFEGVWHGWAMGYNKDKHGRSGALDFRKDQIVFPSPDGFKAVGRKMRARAEGLLQQAAKDLGAAR